jgi:hypothetical protein
MLKDENIKMCVSYKNKNYYENLLFREIEIGEIIEVKSNLVQPGSNILITGICDFCNSDKKISMKEYNKQTNNGINKFSCSKKCSILKTKESNLKKYGVENVFQGENIKNKSRDTKYKLYGDLNYNNRDQSKKTNLVKYGFEYASTSMIIKQKVINTNIERYGCEYASQNQSILNKMKTSNLEKYGVDNYSKTNDFLLKIREKWFETMYSKLESYGLLKKIDNGYTISCEECGKDFTILNTLMNKRIRNEENICLNCNPINTGISKMEKSLLEFIKDNYNGSVIENSRKIIDGLEIDIYLPDLKLGFEFNGLYWHNELYKDRNYHLNKTNKCLENNISLFHIWEDDWTYKQNIVKSMILNKLGKSNKIYARKTEVRVIEDNKLVREFLINNHIQGFVGSKIKLGLYYNNELVTLMTFGNLRKSLGQKSKEGSYELLRFCNKLNTTVVGGSSKLFKCFLNNYDVKDVISYSDYSRSIGNMYKQLGFTLSHNSDPNYYYIIDGIKSHRFNFRKDKLVKEGSDPSLTEIEIMHQQGLYRIFDCGTQKWIKSV